MTKEKGEKRREISTTNSRICNELHEGEEELFLTFPPLI